MTKMLGLLFVIVVSGCSLSTQRHINHGGAALG